MPHSTSGLDVGDAFGAGFREMLLVPGDAAVGGVDIVPHLADAVTFAGITHENGFHANILERDEELFGFGDGHIVRDEAVRA